MSAGSEKKRSIVRSTGLGFLLAALSVAFGCESDKHEPTGGETHFLRRCDPAAAQGCGNALACICGVCSVRCDEVAACREFGGAECVAPGDAGTCASSGEAPYCDVRCTTDEQCAKLSPSHRCDGGVCRAGERTPNACEGEDVTANEVLVIGDAFFAASHQITAFLEDLARGAGALSAGERYRDNSRTIANALALPANGIAEQYATAAAESPVRVVIMNGGGADVLLGSCDTLDATCPFIANAAAAASSLLTQMANDGVLHVVYAFYPDPRDASVREEMDVLRPLIQGACASSPVPCHWVDLRATFAGRYDEYVQGDGLTPTASGSQASAIAIWAVMTAECIAQ